MRWRRRSLFWCFWRSAALLLYPPFGKAKQPRNVTKRSAFQIGWASGGVPRRQRDNIASRADPTSTGRQSSVKVTSLKAGSTKDLNLLDMRVALKREVLRYLYRVLLMCITQR
jgi:hypothetical protein